MLFQILFLRRLRNITCAWDFKIFVEIFSYDKGIEMSWQEGQIFVWYKCKFLSILLVVKYFKIRKYFLYPYCWAWYLKVTCGQIFDNEKNTFFYPNCCYLDIPVVKYLEIRKYYFYPYCWDYYLEITCAQIFEMRKYIFYPNCWTCLQCLPAVIARTRQ